MSAAWRGESAPRRSPLFWEYGRNDEFFNYPEKDRSPNLAVRRGQWKLLVSGDGSRTELYDLSKDVSESNNLESSEPELARELSKLVHEWKGTWRK